jgi:voltage-gated potassium channel
VLDCIARTYLALQGDATRDDLLREAGVQHAKCLLAATDNDANNISVTLSARHLNSKLFIVARSNHVETEAKLKLAGADRVLSPYTIAGYRMGIMAIQSGSVEFFDALTRNGSLELAVEEMVIPIASPLIGKTVAQAQNTLSYGTVLAALKRSGGIMPGSRLEARIGAGDTLIVVGTPKQLAAFLQKNNAQTAGSNS